MRVHWQVHVAAVAAALVALVPTAGANWPTAEASPRVIALVTPAAQASSDARALRSDVANLMQEYLTAYGDRFTSAERRQLLGYRADADRQLASVVLATRLLDRATATAAPAGQRRAAASRAQAAWKRAKSTADASFAAARQIMEPKLSLIEQLTAARDYSTMMGRFDALGARIDEAAQAANRR